MDADNFDYKGNIAPLICPITQEIMVDPVVTICDGHSYERQAIEEWFATGKRVAPATGAEIDTTVVVPNHALRAVIEDFLSAMPEHRRRKYIPRMDARSKALLSVKGAGGDATTADDRNSDSEEGSSSREQREPEHAASTSQDTQLIMRWPLPRASGVSAIPLSQYGGLVPPDIATALQALLGTGTGAEAQSRATSMTNVVDAAQAAAHDATGGSRGVAHTLQASPPLTLAVAAGNQQLLLIGSYRAGSTPIIEQGGSSEAAIDPIGSHTAVFDTDDKLRVGSLVPVSAVMLQQQTRRPFASAASRRSGGGSAGTQVQLTCCVVLEPRTKRGKGGSGSSGGNGGSSEVGDVSGGSRRAQPRSSGRVQIAVGMSDGSLRLWEITGLGGGSNTATSAQSRAGTVPGAGISLGSGHELSVLQAHTASSVNCVRAFSNCKLLLSCAGGELVVTELAQGTRIRAFHASTPALARSGGGPGDTTTPATAATSDTRCVCCDLLHFSGDRVCVSGHSDGLVRLWDLAAPTPNVNTAVSTIPLATLGDAASTMNTDTGDSVDGNSGSNGHKGVVSCLACIGPYVISGGYDRCLRVWDISSQLHSLAALDPRAKTPPTRGQGQVAASVGAATGGSVPSAASLMHVLRGHESRVTCVTTFGGAAEWSSRFVLSSSAARSCGGDASVTDSSTVPADSGHTRSWCVVSGAEAGDIRVWHMPHAMCTNVIQLPETDSAARLPVRALSVLGGRHGSTAVGCSTQHPSVDGAQGSDGGVATADQEAGVLAAYSGIGRQGGEVRLWSLCTDHEGTSRVQGAQDWQTSRHTATAARAVSNERVAGAEGTTIPPAITMSVVDASSGSGRYAAARSGFPALV